MELAWFHGEYCPGNSNGTPRYTEMEHRGTNLATPMEPQRSIGVARLFWQQVMYAHLQFQ